MLRYKLYIPRKRCIGVEELAVNLSILPHIGIGDPNEGDIRRSDVILKDLDQAALLTLSLTHTGVLNTSKAAWHLSHS